MIRHFEDCYLSQWKYLACDTLLDNSKWRYHFWSERRNFVTFRDIFDNIIRNRRVRNISIRKLAVKSMHSCSFATLKWRNLFFPVKNGTAILNYQVRCHMLNQLIFMFWWRYAHICIFYFKIEAWLHNLVRNLLGLIFSIKTSYFMILIHKLQI
jgi:hypothetical protein